MIKSCVVCGKAFEAEDQGFRRLTCSEECREKNRANNDKIRHRRIAEEKKAAEERKRRHKKLTIAEINKMARAKGLSYGKYVEKYGV